MSPEAISLVCSSDFLTVHSVVLHEKNVWLSRGGASEAARWARRPRLSKERGSCGCQARGGRRTTCTKNSSIWPTALRYWSKSTGLVT